MATTRDKPGRALNDSQSYRAAEEVSLLRTLRQRRLATGRLETPLLQQTTQGFRLQCATTTAIHLSARLIRKACSRILHHCSIETCVRHLYLGEEIRLRAADTRSRRGDTTRTTNQVSLTRARTEGRLLARGLQTPLPQQSAQGLRLDRLALQQVHRVTTTVATTSDSRLRRRRRLRLRLRARRCRRRRIRCFITATTRTSVTSHFY